MFPKKFLVKEMCIVSRNKNKVMNNQTFSLLSVHRERLSFQAEMLIFAECTL